jgi:hypothetical protein
MEIRPKTPSEYSGERLTLKDIGVEPEKQPKLQDQELVADKVVRLRTATQPTERTNSPERQKKIKAIVLAGATILAGTRLTQEALSDKVSEAPRIGSLNELDDAKPIVIDEIKPGEELNVSPYSFTITGGNVRTSPQVEPEDENLIQHTDLFGDVITHPIKVTDSSNRANGNWYVFYDANGDKFAINEQNVDVIPEKNETIDHIEVVVDKTTNMGIIAHDEHNISMQVATVISAKK